MKDPYKVLGVPRGANDKEIKDAYRALARKHHPDVNPDDASAEERFKEIQAAHDILTDTKKREAFDQYGERAFSSGSGFPAGGFGVPSFDEIFGGGAMGDVLASLFGGGRGRPRGQRRRRGASLEAECEVTLEEAYHGVEREVTVRRDAACASCDGHGRRDTASSSSCQTCAGSGQVVVQHGPLRLPSSCPACSGSGTAGEPCETCAGRGMTERDEKVRFRIPAGIADGAKLRVAGRGNHAPGGAGDLLFSIRVRPHPRLERRGRDLHVALTLTFTEAALGAEVPVPTIDGDTIVKIPAGTPSGRKIRLLGKGMPNRQAGNGDLYAEIRILPPPDPSPEVRELLERLAELSDYRPRE